MESVIHTLTKKEQEKNGTTLDQKNQWSPLWSHNVSLCSG